MTKSKTQNRQTILQTRCHQSMRIHRWFNVQHHGFRTKAIHASIKKIIDANKNEVQKKGERQCCPEWKDLGLQKITRGIWPKTQIPRKGDHRTQNREKDSESQSPKISKCVYRAQDLPIRNIIRNHKERNGDRTPNKVDESAAH